MGKAKSLLKAAGMTLVGLIVIVWVLGMLAKNNAKAAEILGKIPLLNKVV